jgi:[acyl-carrier-protein] S-malonyltransferase
VRFRAQAMQEAVPVGTGAMAAILGLDAETVPAAPSAAAEQPVARCVEAANFNDPAAGGDRRQQGRGRASACAQAKARAPSARCRCRCRRRSTPALMQPAGASACANAWPRCALAPPRIPVVNNIDVAIEPNADAHPRRAWCAQAFGPVRWVESRPQAASRRAASTHVVECGPGKVLAGMAQAHRRRSCRPSAVMIGTRPSAWPKLRRRHVGQA